MRDRRTMGGQFMKGRQAAFEEAIQEAPVIAL